jgi:uncharacterized phage-associated protein
MTLNIQFTFDHKKGTQVLNYFAIKEGGEINKMKALKLVYFADRYHLRKYGRLITNDEYLAMRWGPVPSSVKDIAESNDFLEDNTRAYSITYVEPSDNLILKSVGNLDEAVFSESDLEALDFSWNKFGGLSQFQLVELTHCYPEWKRWKDILDSQGSCWHMDILDFLKDPSENVEKCFQLNAEEKQLKEDQIIERSHIESMWR